MSWEIKLKWDMCPYREVYADGTLECYNPDSRYRIGSDNFEELILEGKKTGVICNEKNCPIKV